MLQPDINLRGKGSLRDEYRTEDGKDDGMYRINSQCRAWRSKEEKENTPPRLCGFFSRKDAKEYCFKCCTLVLI